ncbi:MAG: RagB/SusD family nutrient uptake outer membrane protein, partial [Odoribacter sp.]|nr:RagB/SusD family nutrient uptake outer membrane protein [Odoribacter sp.]
MKRLAIIWILAALLWGGCDDFLTSRDKSQVLEKTLFTNREGVEDALYGIYSRLANASLYGADVPAWMDLLAQFYTPSNNSLKVLLEYEHERKECRGIYDAIWSTMYKAVSDINNFLANLDAYEGKKLMFEDLYRGEALGLRAYLHFDLLRMFAPVKMGERGIPYVTRFGTSVTSFSTVKECYDFILGDLLEAEKLLRADDTLLVLPRVRSHEFIICRNREVHFNWYAVQATLARVYYMRGEPGDLEKAGQYARTVIESGKFPFITNPKDARFMVAGVVAETEGIWGLSNTKLYESLYSRFVVEGSNSFDPFTDQINLYSSMDWRHDWFRTTPGATRTRSVKIIDPVELGISEAVPAGLEGVNQIRVAEMYLIAAEAAMESNPEAARKYLDDLACSRGLEQFQGELTLDDIDNEWRRELVQEGQ